MESLYGIVGGLLGSNESTFLEEGFVLNFKFGVIGFLLTFLYDLVTNIISGLSAGIPLSIAIITGIPFAIVHEGSNAILFFLGASPLISSVSRFISKVDLKND
jgi:hypothetical protein